uniref:Myb-like domain-containing protein n=1 Tax=Mycena chlorophos TaxID=658473 RepID=A0ABQ0LZ18_MYCCL|nr:predicted protein [Mycena chlorophos]
MDDQDPSFKTIQALRTFIDQQKALLARTKADIDTLRKLKADSITDASKLPQQLDGNAFRLSAVGCESGAVPNDVEWSLFAKKDPKALGVLGRDAHTAYATRNIPKLTSSSGLTEFQKLIRTARKTMIDPVLEKYGDPEIQSVADPNTPRPPPLRGPSGLFVRRREPPQTRAPRRKPTQPLPPQPPPDDARSSAGSSTIVDVDECPSPLPMALAKPKRTRRISTKLERQNLDRSEESNLRTRRRSSTMVSSVTATTPTATPLRITVTQQKRGVIILRVPPLSALPQRAEGDVNSVWDSTDDEDNFSDSESEQELPTRSSSPRRADTPPCVLGKRRRALPKAKVKSATFKLRWSASEQNLLERLLEEIPAEDQNRFSKISKAMDGRRTPRQVASRVQKYFLKLKEYGVI